MKNSNLLYGRWRSDIQIKKIEIIVQFLSYPYRDFFYNIWRNNFFHTGVHDDFNYFNIFTNRSDIRAEFWNNIYNERSNSEINKYLFCIHDINRDQYL
jgi:hypothetical protein